MRRECICLGDCFTVSNVFDTTRDAMMESPMSESQRGDAFRIRPLDNSDAHAFRVLRLQALCEYPEAFGATYVEERDSAWSDFIQRFRAEWISGDNMILGAFLGERLVGSLGFRRWDREKQRHKGYVWIFYVLPDARGEGIGRKLFRVAVEYARVLPDLEQLQLSVVTEGRTARSLYVSFGFESYGRERHALKLRDRYVDTELMVLHLK